MAFAARFPQPQVALQFRQYVGKRPFVRNQRQQRARRQVGKGRRDVEKRRTRLRVRGRGRSAARRTRQTDAAILPAPRAARPSGTAAVRTATRRAAARHVKRRRVSPGLARHPRRAGALGVRIRARRRCWPSARVLPGPPIRLRCCVRPAAAGSTDAGLSPGTCRCASFRQRSGAAPIVAMPRLAPASGLPDHALAFCSRRQRIWPNFSSVGLSCGCFSDRWRTSRRSAASATTIRPSGVRPAGTRTGPSSLPRSGSCRTASRR